MCRYVVLNGKQRLMMPSDTELPTFEPVRLDPGSEVTLSPLTFGFFVFPEANVKICDLWRYSFLFFCSCCLHFLAVIMQNHFYAAARPVLSVPQMLPTTDSRYPAHWTILTNCYSSSDFCSMFYCYSSCLQRFDTVGHQEEHLACKKNWVMRSVTDHPEPP